MGSKEHNQDHKFKSDKEHLTGALTIKNDEE